MAREDPASPTNAPQTPAGRDYWYDKLDDRLRALERDNNKLDGAFSTLKWIIGIAIPILAAGITATAIYVAATSGNG